MKNMQFHFSKYHGTGNDFILIDNRDLQINKHAQALFANMCHRRFGIGADGVILLQSHESCDFEMVYINADGREGSMCGNGGRCVAQFALDLGVVAQGQPMTFMAVDGVHHAKSIAGEIELEMQEAAFPAQSLDGWFMNTGSPHHLELVSSLADFPVLDKGKALRWHEAYQPGGTNVNFIEIRGTNALFVRTYERGVEDETFSCGTGVTAAAILYHTLHHSNESAGEVAIETLGGHLKVSFTLGDGLFQKVLLTGPAVKTFEGKYSQDKN